MKKVTILMWIYKHKKTDDYYRLVDYRPYWIEDKCHMLKQVEITVINPSN